MHLMQIQGKETIFNAKCEVYAENVLKIRDIEEIELIRFEMWFDSIYISSSGGSRRGRGGGGVFF